MKRVLSKIKVRFARWLVADITNPIDENARLALNGIDELGAAITRLEIAWDNLEEQGLLHQINQLQDDMERLNR